MMERRVAPPCRTARPFASLACSCSAPRSCHPGLVQAVVGPAQCGCAKHACCHFARDAASPRPHAWRAGATSAGRPARLLPACAQLPAGPMSRCSHVEQCRLARRCTGTACGSPEKSVEKKNSLSGCKGQVVCWRAAEVPGNGGGDPEEDPDWDTRENAEDDLN